MPTAAPCGQHVCMVAVTVAADCTITVDPDTLEIAADYKHMEIHWRLTGGTFADDGIFLKDPGQNSGGDLHGFAPANGDLYVVKNRHMYTGRRYQYGIRVTNASGQACEKDPWILN
jgi:hypothetical protein